MNRIFQIAVLGLFVIGLANGCQQKKGCMDPSALNYDAEVTEDDGSCVYQSENLKVKFNHKAGNAALIYDTEYTLNTGRKIKFTKAQMYLSGFEVDGGDAVAFDKYLLITAEDDQEFGIGTLVANNITSFGLSIGVDSAHNHLDPATFPTEHALSANQLNFGHWSWNPGYKFIVLEGRIDSSAAMNGPTDWPFIYHLGLDEIYKPFDLDVDFSTSGTDQVIELDLNWLAFFNDLNLPSENTSHMGNAGEIDRGHRIIDQGPVAFSVVP